MSKLLNLQTICECNGLKARLASAGLDASAVEKKVELFISCARSLRHLGLDGETPAKAFFIPGRIEVLGKHTDYAGGRSIIAAVDRGFCIVASRRNDATIRIFNVSDNDKINFPFAEYIQPPMGHWSNYPMTVAKRLVKNFPGRLRGADIAFLSDLPIAGGMSSSSAMIVGFFLVLSSINNISSRKEYSSNIDTPEDLASYLGTIENGQNFGTLTGDKGVGTLGSSEDHTAMLCCQPDFLSQYSYCPVKFERLLKFPSKYLFAVASSGVIAEKTGAAMAKFNRASGLCSCAIEIWNKATRREDKHLADAIKSDANAAERFRKILQGSNDRRFTSTELVNRFEQFLFESEEVVPVAGDALNKGDLARFGREVDRSQQLAETLLGNQVPQTVFLANCARQIGAAAASSFGAGFGGSVWAMIEA
ncbi:MAG: hypothetical protein JSV82_06870, partial [Planctomycetota bacterium]